MKTAATGRTAFDDAPEMTLRDYWHVVLRRKWLLATAVAVTVLAAMFMVAQQSKVYEGEAQMLVRNANGDNVFSNQQQSAQNAARLIDTEIRVLEGNTVEDRVRKNLGLKGDLPDVNGSAMGLTDVISVKVQSYSAETAAQLANAYVDAYIDVRREQNVNGLTDAATEVQNKVSQLDAQIRELDSQIASASAADRPALEAQRQLLVDQKAVFKQRLDQLQVDASVQTGAAQQVRVAEVPTGPVEPTPLRTGALALIVGLLLGLGAAFLADYLDDSVNTSEELERATGGLPVLTTVPEEASPDHRPISLSRPNDQVVEAYRGLRTALQFVAMERTIKTIQFTSPLPGEGKTTTAANLALLMVQAGRRVVLVDADLRRPRVHEVFGADGAKGLTSAMLGDPVMDLLWPVSVGTANLEVLACGPIPTNPSETLGSQRMRAVLDELSRMFDLVIIDSPPVLPVTDAVVVAGLVDAVVLVARANKTTDRQVSQAVDLLSRSGAPLVGCVLNGIDVSRDPYGNSYGYDYRQGYAAYGPKPAKGSNPKKK